MAKQEGKINFISYDKPAITADVYELTVSQSFAVGQEGIKAEETEKKLQIAVQGPRFSLDPQLVTGKFPPDKSLGKYSTVLPHIILKRSTLPWERKISDDSVDAPWLALLLFTKDENISPQTTTLAELQSQKDWRFPALTPQPGQLDTDQLFVIDVSGERLRKVLPTKDALPYLAHVRQSADPDGAPAHAIVVCGRLPKPDSECAVHLVSLEGRTDLFDNVDDNKTYRLVSLASWNFASTPNNATFKDLLSAAYHHADQTNVLRMPTLNLTKDPDGKINSRYGQGWVPLPHQTRQGNQLVSWFRGPLLPGPTKENVKFSELEVTAADQLVRYDTSSGMFDVSYAAAWELGRLLMLRRRRVSVAFYNWKRASLQAAKPIALSHLHVAQRLKRSLELPKAVKDWFVGLSKLNDVPCNYLVPDERELPQPSIRFFSIDLNWIAYLLDGAFSIGRVVSHKPAVDASLRSAIPFPDNPDKMSGFLLRSPVVAGWPHMEVTGYNVAGGGTSFLPYKAEKKDILRLLRMDRIAPDTLLCIFAGDIKTLDLSEKAEAIHFGVTYHEDVGSKTSCYYKVLRNPETGDEYSVNLATDNVRESSSKGHWVTVPFSNPTDGFIDIVQLKEALRTARNKTIVPAKPSETIAPNLFAFEMLDGVAKVRIVRY